MQWIFEDGVDVEDVKINQRERQMFRELAFSMPMQKEAKLRERFLMMTREIVWAKAFHDTVTRRAKKATLGPALRGQRWFMNMSPDDRRSLCDRVNQLNRIFSGWQSIIDNLTHDSIQYLDIRSMDLTQLEKSIKFPYVQSQDAARAPRSAKRRRINAVYPDYMVDDIVDYISRTGILTHVRTNSDNATQQVELIGKDLVEGMLKKQFPPPQYVGVHR